MTPTTHSASVMRLRPIGSSSACCLLFLLLRCRHGARAFSGTIKAVPHLSDRIIHVGNLDWMVPSDSIVSMLSLAVENNVNVTVKQLPHPIRKRDEGKFHSGSATVAFTSSHEANLGMKALSNSSGRELRVRWATVRNYKEETKKEEPLSEARIELRKKRARSYARRRQRVAEKTDKVIQSILNLDDGVLNKNALVLDAPRLDWSNKCPDDIDPIRGGGLTKGTRRGERKQAAVEAFLLVVRAALLGDNDTNNARCVADLGCGAGNLSLPLAWWLREEGIKVLGVDINGVALERLLKRANSVDIPIETLQQDLLQLIRKESSDLSDCSAVVSLHACGAASDLSIAAAVANSLPFAISPCCVGKVNTARLPGRMPSLTSGERSAAPLEITYPRSMWLKNAVSLHDYQMLAAAADYGVGSVKHEDDAQELARRQRCRMAKQIVETDRLEWAKERGYYVRMMVLPRIGLLYPKRELLLGAKEESDVADRISRLAWVNAAAEQVLHSSQ